MSTPDADRWGLRTLMTQTLDPAYAEAARLGRSPGRAGRALAVVVLVLAGIVVGVAFRQQQHQATDRQATRAALIEKISDRAAQVDTLGAQLDTLRAEVAALRQKALGSSSEGAALLDELEQHELLAGLSPVAGPGMTITLAEPKHEEGNDPVGHGQTVDVEAVVTDRDLQEAVNALWSSGAEAIAVNGERIGTTTAIRQAGGAILIDFQPTASPYVIEVVGDPGTLPADFAQTEPARRFSTYRSAYGAQYHIETEERLELPAATEPVTTDDATGGS